MRTMTIDRATAEQALDVLDRYEAKSLTADALRKELQQPDHKQLVGRFTGKFWKDGNRIMCEVVCDTVPSAGAPLYTHPPVEQPTVKDSLTVESSAERTLRQLGYTDCGGEVWKPPLGPAQPAQEPVGEVLNERGEIDYISYVPPVGTHLYTTPPAAQPAQEPVAKLFGTLPVYDTPPAAPEQAEPVPVQHTHQWFSTGAMEPGQMRCIHCGVWGRDVSLSAQPQTSMVNRLPADDTEGGAL